MAKTNLINQQFSGTKQNILCLVLALMLSFNPPAVLADSPFLKKGIEAYIGGDYAAAAGHLGAAQSAEFNNPILHYYMANTFVHLHQRDEAIREYRIAFALDPDSEIAQECKIALVRYHADWLGGRNNKSRLGYGKITFSSDPVIQQAVVAMHKQIDQLTTRYSDNNYPYTSDPNRSTSDRLRKSYNQPGAQFNQNVSNDRSSTDSYIRNYK